jgi:hypothetical protein
MAFGILTHCFVQCPLYLLGCTPPFSTFIQSFLSFDSLEGLLGCKQAFFLITFGGGNFILTSTIALVAYLKNWAFIISTIATRFMVDQCPFLFEALT